MIKNIYTFFITFVFICLVFMFGMGWLLNLPTSNQNELIVIVKKSQTTDYSKEKNLLYKNHANNKYFILFNNNNYHIDRLKYLLLTTAIIRSGLFFDTIAIYFGIGGTLHKNTKTKLKPGLYRFAGNESTLEIINRLVTGKSTKNHILILPGDNLARIATKIQKYWNLPSISDITKSLNRHVHLQNIKNRYGINDLSSVEGFIYPGVYFLYNKSAFAEEIHHQGSKYFHAEIGKYLPNKKLMKILANASFVEKGKGLSVKQPICSPSRGAVVRYLARR